MRNRRRIWPFFLVVGILVFAIALRLALPSTLEFALENALANVLYARVDIEVIHLDLRGGVITIRAELRSQEADALLARVDAIELDVDWESLASGSLVAERVALVGPEFVFAFDEEDRFNWQGVRGKDNGSDAEPRPEAKPAGTFRIEIKRLEIGTGELRITDETAGGLPNLRLMLGSSTFGGIEFFRGAPGDAIGWALASADASEWMLGIVPDGGARVDFELKAEARAITNERIPLEISLNRDDGLELRIDATIRPTPLEVDASFSWSALRSRDVLGYLDDIGMDVKDGSSKGDFEFELSFAPGPNRGIRFRGNVTHDALDLDVAGDSPTSLAVKRIHVEVGNFFVPIPEEPVEAPPPILLHLAAIDVDDPLLRITLAGPGSPPKPSEAYLAETTPEPISEPTRLEVRIDRVSLEGGRVLWSDPETGADRQNSVTLEGEDLRWPHLFVHALRLRVGGLAPEPVRVDGSGSGETAQATLRARRISLPEWNPVIAHYTDYSVSRGTLSVDGILTVQGDAYDFPLTVVLQGLRADSQGDAFQKTFGVPISLAIRLLTDSSGAIRLAVPVSGTFSQGTRVDVTATIAAALQGATGNALKNTVNTPVEVAGSALRRVGEVFMLGLGEATFDAGEHTLDNNAKAVLKSAAAFVGGTNSRRIELIPELVNADLHAYEIHPGERRIFDAVRTTGRILLGGKKRMSEEDRERVRPLANNRIAAAERYLVESCGFPRDRIIGSPWDGKVADGIPRVLLRLKGPK